MVDADTGECAACASHCRKCHDTSSGGCDECFFMYRLDSGACSFDQLWAGILALCVGLVGVLLFRWCSQVSTAERRQAASHGLPAPPSQVEYVSVGQLDALEAGLPSGMWRGYYTFSGARHDVCEFNLTFGPGNDQVRGDGVDDVGQYTIEGLCRGSRLAFAKTYIPRSRNHTGVVTYGNQGHSVEYRGELAGSSLGGGFRGAWSIRAALGHYDGQFHLWPAMEGWSDQAPGSSSGASAGPVFEESECVICYDRAISTCLRPCGHVALCGVCAARLSPRKCPLCRATFSSIENRTAP